MTSEQRECVVRLRNQGMGYTAIAKAAKDILSLTLSKNCLTSPYGLVYNQSKIMSRSAKSSLIWHQMRRAAKIGRACNSAWLGRMVAHNVRRYGAADQIWCVFMFLIIHTRRRYL